MSCVLFLASAESQEKGAALDECYTLMDEGDGIGRYPTTKENLKPSALAISINVLSCMSV